MKQIDNILWWNLRVTNIFYKQRALLEPADKRWFNTSRQPFACINLDACRQYMSAILVWCTSSFWRGHEVARIHIDNLDEFAPQIQTKTSSMHVLVAANISRVQVDTQMWLTSPFPDAKLTPMRVWKPFGCAQTFDAPQNPLLMQPFLWVLPAS